MKVWSRLKITARNLFRKFGIEDQLDDQVHAERIAANMSALERQQTSQSNLVVSSR